MSEEQGAWQRIAGFPRPAVLVDFPRVDPATGEPVTKVWMQILTHEELQDCIAAKEARVQGLLKGLQIPNTSLSEGYETISATELSIQILCRSVLEPDAQRAPLFPGPRECASVLTQDEIGMLMRQYSLVQDACGPERAHMSHEEVEGYVRRLGGGGGDPLSEMTSEEITDLVMTLVQLTCANREPS